MIAREVEEEPPAGGLGAAPHSTEVGGSEHLGGRARHRPENPLGHAGIVGPLPGHALTVVHDPLPGQGRDERPADEGEIRGTRRATLHDRREDLTQRLTQPPSQAQGMARAPPGDNGMAQPLPAFGGGQETGLTAPVQQGSVAAQAPLVAPARPPPHGIHEVQTEAANGELEQRDLGSVGHVGILTFMMGLSG